MTESATECSNPSLLDRSYHESATDLATEIAIPSLLDRSYEHFATDFSNIPSQIPSLFIAILLFIIYYLFRFSDGLVTELSHSVTNPSLNLIK